MASFDWRLDSPWQRLHWTLPGALLIGLAALWALAAMLHTPEPPPLPVPAIEAQLIELPPPEAPPRQKKSRRKAEPQLKVDKPRASMAAPPAPSAEEWQLASTYTLKNSKRYRYTWGQQVRSQMGTAIEGVNQGMVRLRIEIAPDGKLAKIEEIWSTSPAVTQRAMQAIRKLPPLPATPTGKPLIFEQTIAFMPYQTGWPPSYKNDCLPDPPAFKNPFAWDGRSPMPVPAQANATVSTEQTPPAECDPASTSSSIDEEERELQRQMDQNRWGR